MCGSKPSPAAALVGWQERQATGSNHTHTHRCCQHPPAAMRAGGGGDGDGSDPAAGSRRQPQQPLALGAHLKPGEHWEMHVRVHIVQRGAPVSSLAPHAHISLSAQQIWDPTGPQVRPLAFSGAQGPIFCRLGSSCAAAGAGTDAARMAARAWRSSQAAMFACSQPSTRGMFNLQEDSPQLISQVVLQYQWRRRRWHGQA